MPSANTNISDWKKRSQVDYFSLFIALWLSFNAWFKDWWVTKWVAPTWSANDRPFILKLKEVCDGSNKMYAKFTAFIDSSDLRWLNFKTHLAWLYQALESQSLSNQSIDVSFRNAWISWDWTTKVFKTIITTKVRGVIKLTDSLNFIDDKDSIFRALMENIYQIRCMLVHGDLEASDWNHRIIQYAYLVLNDLTEDF